MTPRGYGPSASFCPRCATPLSAPAPTTCTGCGYQLFVNARPTVGLIVLDRDPAAPPAQPSEPAQAPDPAPAPAPAGPRFLAVRRAAEPMIGRWEMPGGFCDGWEHPAEAAVREAREELGVEITLGDFIGMYVGSYEFQDEFLPVLDNFFLATLEAREIVLDPAESTELTWFSLADPPPLAFATMDAAIRDAARRLGH
ncbi:NUDIX hydrolase [Plantactinospora sp. S1510]|uniref:NUDIX hydrolase n=1 Tax=Plantactinospora alkalitolerans TaxID=2789879 RepID=A0ABS0H3R5_9ACTN|nr:NUDIX hydrolase [Plantactinospora alkalitolerans]MBF9133105.1 NUDIX hydrolase [Plantactinospora alkalitolerans]